MKPPAGGKINQKLADIVVKRWGAKLGPDRIKPLLEKHVKPANCTDIMPRVNPEIYGPNE